MNDKIFEIILKIILFVIISFLGGFIDAFLIDRDINLTYAIYFIEGWIGCLMFGGG